MSVNVEVNGNWGNVMHIRWLHNFRMWLLLRGTSRKTTNVKSVSPSVQVWNANFRQQMVHQSRLCYKDLTLLHFGVSSTSVRRARVINWKSVCTVLCCCANMSRFIPNKELSQAPLMSCFNFKKTGAESYRLLRGAYGEDAPSQDTCTWWFRRFKSGDLRLQTRNMENCQKNRKFGIGSIIGRRWFANTKTTRQVIGRQSTNCFQSAIRDGKDSEEQ